MNCICLGGTVGSVESKTVAGKDKNYLVCNMSLAIKKADKSTMWVNLITFNEGLIQKVIQPYVLKGSKIAVQGELNIRHYKNKDEVEKVSVEVLIDDLTLLGSSRSSKDE